MKVVDFIRKFGWVKSISAVKMNAHDFSRAFDIDKGFIIVKRYDLKKYTDAYELVHSCGGLGKARSRAFLSMHISVQSLKYLKKAITLVEEVGECDG